jgi:hypothetical protein
MYQGALNLELRHERMFALLAYGLDVSWRGAADDGVDSCGLFQRRAEARVHHAVDGVMH